MTEIERRVFKTGSLGGLAGFALCMAGAYLFQSNAMVNGAITFGLIGVFSAFLWVAQASTDSLRDYGLGEGTATHYGEEHAKFMFGEDYKKPKDD